MPTLKQILNKEEWSARDIGLLYLYFVKSVLENNAADFPLDPAEFKDIIIKAQFMPLNHHFDQLRAFGDDVIGKGFDYCERNAHLFEGGLYKAEVMMQQFDEMCIAEIRRNTHPLYLTQQGQKYYKNRAADAALTREYSFFEIFRAYLHFFAEKYRKKPITVPAEIAKALILANDQSAAAFPSIAAQYKLHHIGLMTPEGHKLDDMTAKAQVKALSKYARPATDAEKRAFDAELKELDRLYYLHKYPEMLEIMQKSGRDYFNIDDALKISKGEPIDLETKYPEIIRAIEEGNRPELFVTLEPYEKEPDSSTSIYSLLEELTEQAEATGDRGSGLLFFDDQRPALDQLQELETAAPELYNAILDQIKEDLKQLAKLTGSKLHAATVTGRQLQAQSKVFEHLDRITPADLQNYLQTAEELTETERRQAGNGIAFIEKHRRGTAFLAGDQQEGYIYTPPEQKTRTPQSFENAGYMLYFYEKEVEKGYSWIAAFNTFIEIAAEVCRARFMTECAKYDNKDHIILNKIRVHNAIFYKVYRHFVEANRTFKAHPAIFLSNFEAIHPEAFTPSEEQVQAKIEEYKTFSKLGKATQWVKRYREHVKELQVLFQRSKPE